MRSPSVKISLFHCINTISSDDIGKFSSHLGDVELSVVNLICSGKVDIQYILKSIETGSDAVILVGCRTGECKFLQGNLRAQKRAGAVNILMEETGIGADRIRYIDFPQENTFEDLLNELRDCYTQIRNDQNKLKEAT